MGYADYDPEPVSLARYGVLTAIFLYDADADDPSSKWTPLPNVRFLSLSVKEGPAPWEARIRYSLGDPLGDPDDPDRVEELLPYTSMGPRVLQQDDRLVAFAMYPDGSRLMIFDGFFQAPQGDLGANTEFVTATCLGATVREADFPLAGAVVRDGDAPLGVARGDSSGPADPKYDVQTGSLPVRFNPDGFPNATPIDDSFTPSPGDSGTAPNQYPVFIGPYPPANTIQEKKIRFWTLPMAARYIVMIGARTTDGKGNYLPSKYIKLDDISFLDEVLTSIRPSDDPDAGPINPENPDTFTAEDVQCPDLNVTGMAWPDALWRLIEPYGYGMNFVLTEGQPSEQNVNLPPGEETDYPGDPIWTVIVYRKDYSLNYKPLYRQSAGESLDPGETNLQEMSLVRDGTGTANQIEMDCEPIIVESSWVLANNFQVDPADVANLDQFKLGDDGFTGATKNKYRSFVFDECGEGHTVSQPGKTGTLDYTPGKFEPAFLLDKHDRYWVNRRRPPESAELISKDYDGEYLKAIICVSFDYEGPQPGVWDGTGEWNQLISGEWRFLDDRLGIYLTAHDINNWTIAVKVGGLEDLADQTVTLVANFAADSGLRMPIFMVVCPVSTDDDFNVRSPRRASSPSRFTMTRRVDVGNQFRRHVVSKFSWYADEGDFTVADQMPVDDKDAAQALSDLYRRQSEVGPFSGPAVIPRFTAGYSLGDQITDVIGRDIELRMNGGAEQGEAPVYPVCVGIDWDFDGGQQSTTLTLNDHRAAPPPRRGGRRNRR